MSFRWVAPPARFCVFCRSSAAILGDEQPKQTTIWPTYVNTSHLKTYEVLAALGSRLDEGMKVSVSGKYRPISLDRNM